MPDRVTVELAIRRLQAEAADAVYRKDKQAFGACHAETCEWKVAGLHLVGRPAIAQAMIDLGAANARVFMTLGSPILDFGGDGESVSGRTSVVEYVKRNDGGAAVTLGVYYERFVVVADRWLFARRHFDFYYFGPADLSAPFYPLSDYGAPPAMPAPDDLTAGLRV